MTNILKLITLGLAALIAGCASNTTQQAPVFEHAPSNKKTEAAKPLVKKAAPLAGEKDWRPDAYTVKKGDTLYSVGLEYGFDYKEIAQHNNIQAPYVIRVGQQLKLPKPADTVAASTPAPEAAVVATPLKTESPAAAKPLVEPPTFTEPKAVKEPYSDQAMAAARAAESSQKTPPAKPAQPEKTAEKVAEKPIEKTADPAKPESPRTETPTDKAAQAGDDETVEWAWPVNGKTLAGFSDSASAKGIDIGGSAGQAVHAASSGKVVYSGSGLRGYGKLIIIKHNKTYLSAYAHNNQLLVKEGQEVIKGQKIAEMGNTDTDRVKLHFEIRRLGKPVDPVQISTCRRLTGTKRHMQAAIPFLISLAVFILVISGILGIAVNIFYEDGLVEHLLGKIWDLGTHFYVTAVPIIVGAIALGKYWIVPGLNKGGSSRAANMLMFMMMAAGGYFIFLYLTTGTLVYKPPI